MYVLYRFRFVWAISWLLFVTVLFCLPGSAFPSTGFFSFPNADKVIHIGIFTLLAFFWAIAFSASSLYQRLWLIAGALLYGLLVEVVQDRFIPNRSFDLLDLGADGAGTFVGLLLALWVEKNKPL